MAKKLTLMYMPISELVRSPKNPRTIRDAEYKELKKDMADPEDGVTFFEARPCIVSTRTGENVIIAGNQRYMAAKELGMDKVPVYVMHGLTEKREDKLMIKDNLHRGEFDWEVLAGEGWERDELEEWGLDTTPMDDDEEDVNSYSKKIEAPTYTPNNEKPSIADLCGMSRYQQICDEIEKRDIPDEEKQFLRLAATRHIVFDYQTIADYYAHSDGDMKELMENSALVIIDYDNAIRDGYVQLTRELSESYANDHEE